MTPSEPTNDDWRYQQPPAIAAAILISVVSVAAFLIMPILVGAVAGHFALTESEAGYFASAVMSGSALASLLSIGWVRSANWHRALRVAIGLMLIGNTVALWTDDIAVFAMAMCLGSFGGGSAYSLALTMLSDSHQAERHFGFSVAAQVGFQVLGLLLFPGLIETHGLPALLVILLLLALIALPAVRWFPTKGRPDPARRSAYSMPNAASLLALLGCLFFFFNVGCYWSYIELMGSNAGLEAGTLGTLLALGVSLGILGALTASWSGDRYGLALPLGLGALGTCASVLLLGESFSAGAFAASAALYNFVWNLSLTFQYAAVAHVDSTGSSVAAAPAFHAAGGAMGPAAAGMLFPMIGFLAVNVIVIVSVLMSLACFIWALKLHKQGAHR